TSQVHVPQVEPLVTVGDPFAVGRPDRVIVERRRLTQGDLLRLAGAEGVAQVKLVLARFVREVRDPLAVGRPGRRALGGAGGLRQVANVAFFGRDGQDFAAGREHGAGPGRRQRGVAEPLADLFIARPGAAEVGGERHFYRPGFARGQVVEVQ